MLMEKMNTAYWQNVLIKIYWWKSIPLTEQDKYNFIDEIQYQLLDKMYTMLLTELNTS